MKKITLNKKQKQAETLKFLKEELRGDITRILTRKLDQAIKSGAISEAWMEKGNRLLSKSIIDSFCKDRQYSMLDKKTQQESNNLHLFI